MFLVNQIKFTHLLIVSVKSNLVRVSRLAVAEIPEIIGLAIAQVFSNFQAVRAREFSLLGAPVGKWPCKPCHVTFIFLARWEKIRCLDACKPPG